jgi:hypothetical protein
MESTIPSMMTTFKRSVPERRGVSTPANHYRRADATPLLRRRDHAELVIGTRRKKMLDSANAFLYY